MPELFTVLFAWAAFGLSVVMLVRVTLILTGILKGPLLQLFEKYGGDEPHYNFIPRILFWSGVFLWSMRTTVTHFFYIPRTVEGVGVLLIMCAYLYTQLPPEIRNRALWLAHLPPWYDNLVERTSREERRRIAYMWLRLPRRTRLVYNTSDKAFFLWVDLIIMGTLGLSEG